MQFSLNRDELISIVSACQERSYAQQIELLQEKGETLDWLIQGVASHHKNGISNEEASLEKRKQAFGDNTKQVPDPPGFFQLFCQALSDFMLRVLLVASMLSLILETATAQEDERSIAWLQGFAVMVAVLICATVTAVNDYQKERQFLKLNEVADEKKKITIKRNGITMEIHQDFVLVGDVMSISEGMDMPADGILLESNQITTDESAMTGEIDPIHKNVLLFCIKKKQQLEQNGEKNIADKHQVPSPIVMSGTKILTGEGKMMVLVVGKESCIGKVKALLEKEQVQPTPLQQKLESLAGDIGKFGLYSAIIIVAVLLIRFAIIKGITREWDTGKDLLEILDFFILGIMVVVLAIPEGLPLAVTLSLAFSVKKMLRDQNLVRKMEACETMGGANNICSDKTGTLTMNKMTLSQVWNRETIMIDTHQEKFVDSDLSPNQEYVEMFKIASMVNSTAQLEPQEKGSSTEIALLKYFQKMGCDYEKYREKYEAKLKFPFSSSRKRMSVVIQYKGQAYLFIKGASEIVLKSSTSWYNSGSREVEPITPQINQQLNKVITKMAENSLRTLCLGYKKLSVHEDLQKKDEKGVFDCEKQNIVLIAVIGVRDNPRKEVPGAIEKCHKAGITVRMVTGDNIITAQAIAKEIGILKEGSDCIAMEGPDFIKLVGGIVCRKCRTARCDCPIDSKTAKQEGSQLRVDTVANAAEFDKIKDKLLVLARSRPEDKYCLVTGLKERGNVVAVTGDGTNDAPALKKADVGFAMGIAGTEVAREAAAIILVDDNFNSIVAAVLWGRNIFDSIRKFVQFQLTVNIVAVTTTFLGAAIIDSDIMKPIQLLWINLIMDTLASLALATEEPTEDLLDRKPHSRDEYIISKTMLKHIIGQSIYQLVIILILVFLGQTFIPEYEDSYDSTIFAADPSQKWYNGVVGGTVRSGRFHTISGDNDYYEIHEEHKLYSRHFTFIFNAFIMMQIFNFLNARKLHEEFNIFKGIFDNPIFPIVISVVFILQIILVTFAGSPFGVYNNYGLTIQQWLITIAIGSGSLVINFLLKLLPCGQTDHIHEQSGGIGSKVATIRRRSVLSLKRIQERVERDLAKNHPLQ